MAKHKPEMEEYDIRSFVYRARRPLHPENFHTFITSSWLGMIPTCSECVCEHNLQYKLVC
jgi:G3E family GTPase